jgi:hypothetical protein
MKSPGLRRHCILFWVSKAAALARHDDRGIRARPLRRWAESCGGPENDDASKRATQRRNPTHRAFRLLHEIRSLSFIRQATKA